MRETTKLLFMTLGSLSISACSSTQLVDFSVIQQSNQCHISTPSIAPLASEKQQAQFIKSYSLFKTPDISQELTRSFKEHSAHERLFIVSQGTKSTAGYGFDIQGEQAKIDKNTLILPIKFTSPAKDAFLAQVMTSPCLVLGIDSSAHYQTINIDGLELQLSE